MRRVSRFFSFDGRKLKTVWFTSRQYRLKVLFFKSCAERQTKGLSVKRDKNQLFSKSRAERRTKEDKILFRILFVHDDSSSSAFHIKSSTMAWAKTDGGKTNMRFSTSYSSFTRSVFFFTHSHCSPGTQLHLLTCQLGNTTFACTCTYLKK